MKGSLFLAAVLALTLVSCAHREQSSLRAESLASLPANDGRAVFVKNCAHCHGVDARGDEGPDLHNLDESDTWIANRIRNGKKGQMTAFAGKLDDEQINAVVQYLRGLN